MNPGIVHHFNATGYGREVIFVVAAPNDFVAWEKQITETLKDRDPQARWWLGTAVGKSSAAVFHVFCRDELKRAASDYGQKATPLDAADFGRCQRLLEALPEWKPRLSEVAEKYPDTAWPRIIARWQELEAAPPARVLKLLRECHPHPTDPAAEKGGR